MLTTIAAIGGVIAYLSSASAVETARTMITLTKQCQASPSGGPVFVIANVSNTSPIPQTITVRIFDRYYTSNPSAQVGAPVTLAAGQSVTFTAPAGWPWTSAYGPDHQYYAHFSALVPTTKNPQGELQQLKTHELCACGSADTTTTSTTIRF